MAKQKLLKPIHLACSDDDMRPILQHIYIDKGCAIATNGNIMVKSDLMENSLINDQQIVDSLEGKLIHKDVWKDLIKAARITVSEDKINAYTSGGVIEYPFAEPMGEDGKPLRYPNYNTIIPPDSAKQEVAEFGLSSELFAIIGKALKTDRLKCVLNGRNKAICVTPIDTYEEFAIIMPIDVSL